MDTRNFEEIIPGITLSHCSLPSNWNMTVAVVLAKAERLAVVDSGVREFMPNAIEPALASLNAKLADVNLIVNTHGHWDHVQGNTSIKSASGAPIWIPAADANLLESPPDRALNDGDEINLGRGVCFDVVFTPGHSPGMSCLYDHAHRLLIVSDAVQGYGPGSVGLPLYFHSGREYRASLERLLKMDVEIIALGHPFKWSGEAEFVHRGKYARRFIEESLHASRRVEAAVQNAVIACPEQRFDCVLQATLQNLINDSSYAIKPAPNLKGLGEGTIKSELRDLGILT